jgi:hypothetical protein
MLEKGLIRPFGERRWGFMTQPVVGIFYRLKSMEATPVSRSRRLADRDHRAQAGAVASNLHDALGEPRGDLAERSSADAAAARHLGGCSAAPGPRAVPPADRPSLGGGSSDGS